MATVASRHVYKLLPRTRRLIAMTCVERGLLISGAASRRRCGRTAGARAERGSEGGGKRATERGFDLSEGQGLITGGVGRY